jgi:hypothetical protein
VSEAASSFPSPSLLFYSAERALSLIAFCCLVLSLYRCRLSALSRCLLSQSSAGARIFLLAQELVFSVHKDEHAASRTSDGTAIKYIHGEQLPTGRGSDGVNWAPDSDDDVDDSEARDAACTLLHIASRDVWRLTGLLTACHAPPCLWRPRRRAATTLLWIGRGYVGH